MKGFFNKHLGALLALLIVLTIPVGMVWAKYAQTLTVTDSLSLTVKAAVTKEYTIDKQKMWKALQTLQRSNPTTLKFVKGSEVPTDAVRKDENPKGIQAAESGEIGVFFSSNDSTIYIAPVDRNNAVMYAQENCSEFLSSSKTYLGRTLATVNLGNLDTSKVTNMSSMFNGCNGMTTLDLGNLNTSKVTNMSSMFKSCSKLKLSTHDVEKFDTSNVINMQSMFDGCRSITTLDLSSFDTACVTDMSHMFEYCTNLTSLNVSSFNTACVTDMSHMFDNCTKLTSLDVSSFNTEKVTTMSYMFWYCESIQRIDLHSFSNKVLTNCSHMFEECDSMKEIHLCGFVSKTGMNIDYMFADMGTNKSNATRIYAQRGMSIAGSSSNYSVFYRSDVIGPKRSSRTYGYYANFAKQAPDGYFNACFTHTGSNAKSVTFDFSGLNNITAVPRGAE